MLVGEECCLHCGAARGYFYKKVLLSNRKILARHKIAE